MVSVGILWTKYFILFCCSLDNWYFKKFTILPHRLLFLFQHVFIHVVASFSFIWASTCIFSTTRRLACIWKCNILIPNLVCVNILQIEVKKFGMLSNWQREFTMEDILTQLRKEMAAPYNRKLVQPPEGTFFWVDKLKKVKERETWKRCKCKTNYINSQKKKNKERKMLSCPLHSK